MTPQQIVGLFIRLAAIYLAYSAFAIFVMSRAAAANFPEMQTIAWFLVAGALLVAVLLWLFPLAIAGALIPKTRETNVILLPARQAAAAGSALLGLWSVVTTVPHLPILLYQLFGNAFGPGLSLQSQLPSLAQIGIGVFLLCKPWYVAEKIFPADGVQSATGAAGGEAETPHVAEDGAGS